MFRGAPGGEALTHSVPTAVCGGASRPADPAPHRPGRHGWLCGAHDHRAGAAGELPCSGGGGGAGGAAVGRGRGGGRGSSCGHPKVLISAPGWPAASRPQVGLPSPSFCPTHSPRLGPDPQLPWAVSFHSYLNQLLPAGCFLTTTPPALQVPLLLELLCKVFLRSPSSSCKQP